MSRPSTSNVYGCQPYVVRSDNSAPKMTNAYTGQFWDLTKVLGEGETDRASADRTKADPTQVRVEFDENVNGATVQASDFQVAGRVALEANHYDGAKKPEPTRRPSTWTVRQSCCTRLTPA